MGRSVVSRRRRVVRGGGVLEAAVSLCSWLRPLEGEEGLCRVNVYNSGWRFVATVKRMPTSSECAALGLSNVSGAPAGFGLRVGKPFGRAANWEDVPWPKVLTEEEAEMFCCQLRENTNGMRFQKHYEASHLVTRWILDNAVLENGETMDDAQKEQLCDLQAGFAELALHRMRDKRKLHPPRPFVLTLGFLKWLLKVKGPAWDRVSSVVQELSNSTSPDEDVTTLALIAATPRPVHLRSEELQKFLANFPPGQTAGATERHLVKAFGGPDHTEKQAPQTTLEEPAIAVEAFVELEVIPEEEEEEEGVKSLPAISVELEVIPEEKEEGVKSLPAISVEAIPKEEEEEDVKSSFTRVANAEAKSIKQDDDVNAEPSTEQGDFNDGTPLVCATPKRSATKGVSATLEGFAVQTLEENQLRRRVSRSAWFLGNSNQEGKLPLLTEEEAA